MARIDTTIIIRRPIEQVFDYVITPASWPQWPPSSLAVVGAADGSLQVGERVTEEFRVAGRRGRVVWTVRERQAPFRWAIDAVIEGRDAGGTITYSLTAGSGGTTFRPEFAYQTPGVLFSLLDGLTIRRRVRIESTEALRRLKAVLEA